MLRPLEWDSDFFRLRIGNLDLEEADDFLTEERLQQELAMHGGAFDLVYLRTILPLSPELLKRVGGVDVG